MHPRNMLVARNLRKVFPTSAGEVVAVDDVSLSATAGTIVGLLGPNGAGKTTTLRMLTTLLRPTTGTASICGHEVTRAPEQARAQIGFLTSSAGLYPRLTPREVMAYFGRLYGRPVEQTARRAAELFAQFDLDRFADRPIHQLSSGTKQRVSLVRAVIHDPPVLLLDEPTAGLDVLATRVLRDFMRAAAGSGKCVLFSTHIMSEAETLCDHVAFVFQGRIVATGSVDELKARAGADSLEGVFLQLVAM